MWISDRGNSFDVAQYNADTVLPPSDIGKLIIAGGGGSRFTLPLTASVPQGSRFRFISQGGSSKLIPQAGDCLWVTNACLSESVFSGRGFASVTKTGSTWVLDSGDGLTKFSEYRALYDVGLNVLNYTVTDGYLIVYAIGAYMNGLEVLGGYDASVPWTLGVIGDDMNYNSKAWTISVPLRRGMYYYIKNGSNRLALAMALKRWGHILCRSNKSLASHDHFSL